MNAETLAAALGAKDVGPHKWKALCPAHEDHHPSLAIGESDTGKVLVKCWAGCSQAQVIAALQARGFWHHELVGAPPIRRPAQPPLAPTAEWQLREMDRCLMDAEFVDPEAPYLVIGEILESAATVTYHCVSRVAAVLNERGESVARHVARWMHERYPESLFEPRT